MGSRRGLGPLALLALVMLLFLVVGAGLTAVLRSDRVPHVGGAPALQGEVAHAPGIEVPERRTPRHLAPLPDGTIPPLPVEGAGDLIPPEDPRAVENRGTVRGVVLGPDGEPAEGATVWSIPAHAIVCFTDGYDAPAHYQYIRYTASRTVTDASGRYEFVQVGMGANYAVVAEAPGTTRGRANVFVEGTEPVVAAAIALERTASLTVTVLDPDGRQVDGAYVIVDRFLFGTDDMRWHPGTSRHEGRSAGLVKIWAVRAPFRAAEAEVELASGEHGAVTVRLEVGGETVEGTVVDDRGEPVEGASIRVWSSPWFWMGSSGMNEISSPDGPSDCRGVTDSAGGFRLTGLRRGSHHLRVTADGHVSKDDWEFAVPQSDADVRVVLSRAATLRLRVLHPGGVPVPAGTQVRVESDRTHWTDAGPWRPLPWNGGDLEVPGVEPGARRLLIVAEGLVPVALDFEAGPGETADLGELRMAAAGVLAGRVVDEDGAPVAAANVHASQHVGVSATQTDVDGWFHLAGLPPGPAQAWVHAPGFLGGEALGTAGDPSGAAEVTLRRAAVLRGRALTAEGHPRPEREVVLFRVAEDGSTSHHAGCFSDHRGVFTLEAAPGLYRLGTSGDFRMSRAPTGADVELRVGEPTWIILRD